MPNILITGGTGYIGTALTSVLVEKGYDVIILTRQETLKHVRVDNTGGKGTLSYAYWNTREQTIDKTAIENADHIIHLAGADIGEKRWTKKRKKEIVESRTKTAELLVKALATHTNHVETVISAGGISWYGPDPTIPNNKPFTEEEENFNDFLGETSKAWEESIMPAAALGKRVVIFRTGIVISKKGGFIEKFKTPLRFGIAPILGDGRQIISWIYREDLISLYVYAIGNKKMEGIYNAVSPSPITAKSFVIKLAKKTRGKFYIPVYVPSFILKLQFGERVIEALKSTTVSSGKIEKAGFIFVHPTFSSVLSEF